MLSAARNFRNADLSHTLYNRMKSLFPDYKSTLISASILLSNTYQSMGNYEKAQEVRSDRVKHLGKKVTPGCSWTEVNGKLVVSDRTVSLIVKFIQRNLSGIQSS